MPKAGRELAMEEMTELCDWADRVAETGQTSFQCRGDDITDLLRVAGHFGDKRVVCIRDMLRPRLVSAGGWYESR